MSSGKRVLDKGAFRMLSFEMRKNDNSLARDNSRPTTRDSEGKH